MVKYKSILKIIDEYTLKCRTIAEIKTILSAMSQEEKNSKLIGLLNQGEEEYYEYLSNKLEEHYADLEDFKEELVKAKNGEGIFASQEWIDEFEEAIGDTENKINELEPTLFKFERRIVEGYKPKVNDVEYVNDEDYYVDTTWLPSKIDEMEQSLIDKQNPITFTDEELNNLSDYFGNGAKELNSYLNKGDSWNKLSDEEKSAKISAMKDMDKHLHNSIEKTDGITQQLTVWHGGLFDVTKNVGDNIKLKGYTSASFREDQAQMFKSDYKRPLAYVYKILLPTGTKGLCGNAKHHDYVLSDGTEGYSRLSLHKQEHEFLLDKNFEGQILDIDYNNHIVTVLKTE